MKFTVSTEQHGMRVDLVVASALGGLTRKQTAALFDTGSVLSDGRRAQKGDRALAGSGIEVTCDPGLARKTLPDSSVSIDVAYEDPHIAIVAKPAGVPTHPNRPGETGTLANGLIARWPALSGVGHKPFEPGLVHRLDTGTSGLLVVALTRSAFRSLRGMFEKGVVEKEYLAVVEGNPPPSGVIDLPLAHDPGDRRKMLSVSHKSQIPNPKSRFRCWPATTRFETVARSDRTSMLRVTIEGGVMHQIRAHLAHAGFPVAGDALYGSTVAIEGRFLLHASRIAFDHPITNARIDVRSDPSFSAGQRA